MFLKTEHITPRLCLDPLTLGEIDFIIELVNSPGWLAFIGDRQVHNREMATQYIQKILDRADVVYWVVKLKETHTPIGVITYIQRSYLDYPDLGFAFLPAYTQHGYAAEAAGVVLNDLQSKGGHPQILATTVPANLNSIRLLTKLGFRFTREIQHEKDRLHLYTKNFD
jgi:ribosomal-protein-alanine N-acetyltransferase